MKSRREAVFSTLAQWLVRAGLFGLFLMLWLPTLATRWLLDGEPPVRSDLTLVLACGSRERIATGLELFPAGYAPQIAVTSPEGYPDQEVQFLEQSGVPREEILLPPPTVSSTYGDALCIRTL